MEKLETKSKLLLWILVLCAVVFGFSFGIPAYAVEKLSQEEIIRRQMSMIEMGISLSPEMSGLKVDQVLVTRKAGWAKHAQSAKTSPFCVMSRGTAVKILGFTADARNALVQSLQSQKETRIQETSSSCHAGQTYLVPLTSLKNQ